MSPLENPAIRHIVVAWWTNQLAAPKHDNGDLMSNVLMRRCVQPRDGATLGRFTAALDLLLQQHPFGPDPSAPWEYHRKDAVILAVDYDPSPMLVKALTAAGITGADQYMALPVKTTMWIFEDGRVEVTRGYRAPIEKLWPPIEHDPDEGVIVVRAFRSAAEDF